MADWKAGDRFKLECEGEISYVDADHHVDVLIDGKPSIDDNGNVQAGAIEPIARRFFDLHATKIQQPFQFGDRVEFGGGRSRVVVVEDERASGMVTVHQEGNPENIDVHARQLTLLIKDK